MERFSDLPRAGELAFGAVDLGAAAVQEDDGGDLLRRVALVGALASRVGDVEADDSDAVAKLLF